MENKIVLDDLAAYIVGLFPKLNTFEQRLSIILYRSLAKGEAVSPRRLAEQIGSSVENVNAILHDWPGVFFDKHGSIVGYWGLSIPDAYESPHRVTVGGRTLSAWCAWDTLFLPWLLGNLAKVESVTPEGAQVSLRVSPARLEWADPVNVHMSFVRPAAAAVHNDIVTSFCHFVHFFASPEAGQAWVARHPGTFLLPIDKAYELARQKNRLQYQDTFTSASSKEVAFSNG
jgi:alkylmercury lyase